MILHHTGVSGYQKQYQSVENYHKENFGMKSSLGKYCCYTWFIEKDGQVIQARDPKEEGCHTIGANFEPAACMAGNFSEEFPTIQQIEKVKDLSFKYPPLEFHREKQPGRICPGTNIIVKSIFEPIKVLPDIEERKKMEAIKSQLSFIAELVARLRFIINSLKK